MGWLFESEVRCIAEQKSSVHYLSNVDGGNDPKLLAINLSPGVTLAVEAKTASLSSVIPGSRLLLYTINTYKEQGDEPITAQTSLISKGQSTALLGWTFNVLDSDTNGLLVEVIKTDIDKFVPPPLKPATNNQNPKVTAIKVTKGEIVSTGYLKARATWQVTGHQSYRVYVIAADDPQKVFFESRILNGSQNPIVVEISGLPCNRELRTMTMFFSEKDGKGEKLVMENKELSLLSCEDTTKKP
jgi:hypothetical protein